MKSGVDFLLAGTQDYVWGESDFDHLFNTPLSLAYCSLIIIQKGHIHLNIQFKSYHLQVNDVLVLAEDSLTLMQNKSSDFSCIFCIFNRKFGAEVAYRLPHSLFSYLYENPCFSLNKKYTDLLHSWQHQTQFIMQSTTEHQRILLCNHLQNLFLVMAEWVGQKVEISSNEYSRKEKLCWRFWEMVKAHSQEQREVAFYAEALHITPYYLAQLCRQFFNDSPKTLIDRQVILKLKEQLISDHLSIQMIADTMHFADASYMNRYFKKHTGFTLLQYRKGK